MDDREKARQYHEQERSKKERIADESFRSTEVTDDYQEWRSAPGRKDFEGVDTIPPERKKQRAESALETAQDVGIVENFVEADSTEGLPGEGGNSGFSVLKGSHDSTTSSVGVRADLEGEDRQSTLAHEVGHAVDHGDNIGSAGSMKGLVSDLEPMITSERMTGAFEGPIDDQNEATTEMIEASERQRGEIEGGDRSYREEPTELFADFFAEAVLRPRNAKAQTEESREALSETLADPPEELEPTREFFEEELPDNFLPGL